MITIHFMFINISLSTEVILNLFINILFKFSSITFSISFLKTLHYLLLLTLSLQYFFNHFFRNHLIDLIFTNLLYFRKSNLKNSFLIIFLSDIEVLSTTEIRLILIFAIHWFINLSIPLTCIEVCKIILVEVSSTGNHIWRMVGCLSLFLLRLFFLNHELWNLCFVLIQWVWLVLITSIESILVLTLRLKYVFTTSLHFVQFAIQTISRRIELFVYWLLLIFHLYKLTNTVYQTIW